MASIPVEATASLKETDGKTPRLGADGKQETRTYTANYDFGDDLEGLKTIVNDDSKVYFNARRSFIIDLQNKIRSWLEEGLSDDEVETKVEAWEYPSGAPRGKDPVEKAVTLFAGMDEATRAKALEQLLAMK